VLPRSGGSAKLGADTQDCSYAYPSESHREQGKGIGATHDNFGKLRDFPEALKYSGINPCLIRISRSFARPNIICHDSKLNCGR
jgi:hypothetical protein